MRSVWNTHATLTIPTRNVSPTLFFFSRQTRHVLWIFFFVHCTYFLLLALVCYTFFFLCCFRASSSFPSWKFSTSIVSVIILNRLVRISVPSDCGCEDCSYSFFFFLSACHLMFRLFCNREKQKWGHMFNMFVLLWGLACLILIWNS